MMMSEKTILLDRCDNLNCKNKDYGGWYDCQVSPDRADGFVRLRFCSECWAKFDTEFKQTLADERASGKLKAGEMYVVVPYHISKQLLEIKKGDDDE